MLLQFILFLLLSRRGAFRRGGLSKWLIRPPLAPPTQGEN